MNSLSSSTIHHAVGKLGSGPLTEAQLSQHVWPLFSRVLQRSRIAPTPPVMREPEIYLANHSLGRPLDQMALDVHEALDLWFEHLDGAWSHPRGWLAASCYFREQVAALLGASSYQSIVPKSSAGQGLRAVLNSLSDQGHVPTVVATRGEFDSCDVILKTYAQKGRAKVRWIEPDYRAPIEFYSVKSLKAALDQHVDLVLCSQVLFATGQVLDDIPELVKSAHQVGAKVIVDTYHSFGVLPLEWEGMGRYGLGGADFLIGGSYKYARGGPGACWLAIHPRHLESNQTPSRLTTLDTGWFAKEQPFAYLRPDPPIMAAGGDAWLESTPPVLTAYQANSGLQLLRELGVDRLREYNLQQQQSLCAMMRLLGIAMYEPKDWESRGAFALLPHPQAAELSQRLLQHGLNTDARNGSVRFGPDLLTTQAELEKATEIVRQVL
ncbi:MAG: aminotransferase class V-fold PLP-dependent enzyme [Planctomycetaceae bacterium]|nr:aminotransferase class V-fold PLP-dependent enzyme [Planctomycetaceae bacterium]